MPAKPVAADTVTVVKDSPDVEQYFVPAVRRAGQILRLLAESERPLRLSDLGKHLELPRSTVFRIVRTLEEDGFVRRVDANSFAIGRLAYLVGSAYRAYVDLESAFRSTARALVAEYNETVQMAVLDGTSVLYVAKEESTQPVRLASATGSRLPAHVTSLGKALLALLSEEELRRLYGPGALSQMTYNSHQSVESLMLDLEETRRRGWAQDNEETALGLICVGSPIFAAGADAVAAISLSIPTMRATPQRIGELGKAIRLAAHDISIALGAGRP